LLLSAGAPAARRPQLSIDISSLTPLSSKPPHTAAAVYRRDRQTSDRYLYILGGKRQIPVTIMERSDILKSGK